MKNIRGSRIGPFAVGRYLRAALALVVSAVLVSCGGGGVVQTGVSMRALSAEFGLRKAVAYAPFRTAVSDAGRDTEVITPAMIEEDLRLLERGGFRLIRLFDSSDKVAKQTLRVIKDKGLDIKVMLGIWITSSDQTANNQEIARGVALANDPDFRDIVVAVSVANETLVSWNIWNPVAPDRLAQHIKRVRDQITQPVTTDDNWAPFAGKKSEKDVKVVLDAIDFVSMHTYPLADTVPPAVPDWDWQQFGVPAGPARAQAMADAAIAEAKRQYQAVRAHLDALGYRTMPVVIGETGWKAVPSNGETYRAHPVNQKMYVDGLNAWSAAAKISGGPASIVYFEAFDEPWKQGDDKWGLFTVARKARYVIQGLYEQGIWDTTYTDADAVYAPDITQVTITADRFTIYSDVATPGEAVSAVTGWFGWDNPPNAFAGDVPVPGGSGESALYKEVAPVPSVYGWGMLAASGASADLSQFLSTGRLNFSVRTTYGGKLEVGFISGSGGAYASVTLSNTNADGYGFLNDGQWHAVSVPISAMTVKPSGAYDLTKVSDPFVISDRYDITGNTNRGATTKIDIDAVFWSK